MVEPVRNVLTGDAKRCPVLHQLHPVEVRYLGAADALSYPSHHVAQQRLHIALKLALDVRGFESSALGRRHERGGEQIVEVRTHLALELVCCRHRRLHIDHARLQIVQRVQSSGGGGRHPRRRATSLKLRSLGAQKAAHIVRFGPHTLANLALANKAVREARGDIVLLVCWQPRCRLETHLRTMRSRSHVRTSRPGSLPHPSYGRAHALWRRCSRPWAHRSLEHSSLIGFTFVWATPACMAVRISSAVRSRKPVLMKTRRCRAACIALARLSDVRRSSSMIPIFRVCCGNSSTVSTASKRSTASCTSSGPCIFGLTMYTEPSALLHASPRPRRTLTSCRAHAAVTIASIRCSGTGVPSAVVTASERTCMPTLRARRSD
mmetsp:Transcript_20697/g.52748  ORF Transcript_20697/g.52748 Transcript_20697/m.52748 type:complete len:378 (+) Transcript_20697:701-1834(+)